MACFQRLILSRHICWNPARPVNGLATTSRPSVILSGRAGSDRGAGPPTTLAAAAGSNCELWHGHSRRCDSGCQSMTSHPACVQIAE